MGNAMLLNRLAERYSTPLFVYDGDLMVRRFRDLYNFIPCRRLQIHYAMKANYNPSLLSLLRDAGAGIDAVSPGEVIFALKLGFPKEKIIFTANNLTDAEFEKVCRTGVVINIGSLSRLRKAGAMHPGMAVCLRFNPDVTDGDNEKTMTAGALTKFGILLEDLPEVLKTVKECRLHVIGLHEHTGSGLQHTGSVLAAMRKLMSVASRENFPELEFLDFGGGFKVPYKPGEERVDYPKLGAEIAKLFQEFCTSYGRELELKFEPGKYLSAECGTLLTRVNTLKDNRGRLIAGCDAGFPQLIRPVLYGAYHIIENLSNPGGSPRVYDICGNICETGDRFAEQRKMPEIREGDLLAIANAGAYCYAMGGIYNLRAMPGEAVISGGKVIALRRRLTDEELIDQIEKECITCSTEL